MSIFKLFIKEEKVIIKRGEIKLTQDLVITFFIL
jgi:hypothetical protein